MCVCVCVFTYTVIPRTKGKLTTRTKGKYFPLVRSVNFPLVRGMTVYARGCDMQIRKVNVWWGGGGWVGGVHTCTSVHAERKF